MHLFSRNNDDPLKTAVLTLSFSPGLADSRQQLIDSFALKIRENRSSNFCLT